MRRIGRILAALFVVACAGGQAGPSAPRAAPSAAAELPPTFTKQQLAWLATYDQAGFPSIDGATRVELLTRSQLGSQGGWRLPGQPASYLLDTLFVSSPARRCLAMHKAPQLLRSAIPESWANERCEGLGPETLPADFLVELQATLDDYQRRSRCPPRVSRPKTAVLEAAWDSVVSVGDAAGSGGPGGLRWVAYARWARELGRDELARSALRVAERELYAECAGTSCDPLRQLRSQAQRVLVGTALQGLSKTWMDRSEALRLAKRAAALAPKAETNIAEQTRALAAQLERDVARDQWRREAGQKAPSDLSPEEQIDAYLELLPDETGGSVFGSDAACAPLSPAAKLADRGPTIIPRLMEWLGDDRLTRTAGRASGPGVPLFRVGEVALLTIERIAQRRFRPSRAESPSHCRTPSSADCWKLQVAKVKAILAGWWKKAKDKPSVELAAEALLVASGSDRPSAAATLRSRDPERFIEEVVAAYENTLNQQDREQWLQLLRPHELGQAERVARCAVHPARRKERSGDEQLYAAATHWAEMKQRLAREIDLPPNPRRKMFRVLLQALNDDFPQIRLVAARTLLSWGRTDGLHAIIRDARQAQEYPSALRRPVLYVDYLIATGTAAGIDTASELIDPTDPEAIARAANGLTEALLTSRAKHRRLNVPGPARAQLLKLAADVLRSGFRELDRHRGLRSWLDDAAPAQRLLSMLRSGHKYSPPSTSTPFERLLAAKALLNEHLDEAGEASFEVPLAVLPPAPATPGESAWATVRATHTRGKGAAGKAATELAQSWKDTAIKPEEVFPAFAQLPFVYRGIEWRLHLVRHPDSRGVTVLLDSRQTPVDAAELSAGCYGPEPCPELHHSELRLDQLKRRVEWFSKQVSVRWPEHRDRTFEALLTVALPPLPADESCREPAQWPTKPKKPR